ncbi:MAG: class I SAM-dependent methyltransferase [Hungatella sp.]|nr:class I SAM-dependent methyltransferase [Hungatella sp.]MCI7380036.1 class I SAM-dependent methyltransferase [Hungatella sp.]
MGILKQFFNNTRKPNGWMGKLMVNGMNQGHAAVSDWGLSYFPDVPGAAHSMLADFGCGGGRNTAELLKRFPEARVTALDYSKVACDKTKQFNRNEVQAGRCNVVQGDVSRLPFEAATFDVITAFETVYFWPGPVESFQEVWRVLKPGGTFMIVNESDGRNTKDEKWAGIIDGMRIFTQECALPGFVDSKNEEKTERNAGYLVVSHSGGGMLRQGTRKGIRRTPANRGMRAHWVVKGLDISEDVCHGMCP